MGFISDLLVTITSFRIKIGQKMNKLWEDIGNKSNLNTTDKTNIVNAINEVKGSIPNVTGFVPYTGANQTVNINNQRLLTDGVISKTTGTNVINLVSKVVAHNQTVNSIVLEVKGLSHGTLMGTYSFELFRYLYTSYKFDITSYFYNNDWHQPIVTWMSGDSSNISAINFLKKSDTEFYIEIVFNSSFLYLTAKVDWLGNVNALGHEFNLYRDSDVDLTTSTISHTRITSKFVRDSYLWDKGNFSQTNINNWNTAFTNNHTHTNKTVLDGITSTLVSNWNTAHGWGNHDLAGYLKDRGLHNFSSQAFQSHRNAVTYWAEGAGFGELYGTSLHLRSANPWHNRLDMPTQGNLLPFWRGTNTTTMTKVGNVYLFPDGVTPYHSGNLNNVSQLTNDAGYIRNNIANTVATTFSLGNAANKMTIENSHSMVLQNTYGGVNAKLFLNSDEGYAFNYQYYDSAVEVSTANISWYANGYRGSIIYDGKFESRVVMPQTNDFRFITVGATNGSTTEYANMNGIIDISTLVGQTTGNFVSKTGVNIIDYSGWALDAGVRFGVNEAGIYVVGNASTNPDSDGFITDFEVNVEERFIRMASGGTNPAGFKILHNAKGYSNLKVPDEVTTTRVIPIGFRQNGDSFYADTEGIVNLPTSVSNTTFTNNNNNSTVANQTVTLTNTSYPRIERVFYRATTCGTLTINKYAPVDGDEIIVQGRQCTIVIKKSFSVNHTIFTPSSKDPVTSVALVNVCMAGALQSVHLRYMSNYQSWVVLSASITNDGYFV